MAVNRSLSVVLCLCRKRLLASLPDGSRIVCDSAFAVRRPDEFRCAAEFNRASVGCTFGPIAGGDGILGRHRHRLRGAAVITKSPTRRRWQIATWNIRVRHLAPIRIGRPAYG